MKNKNNNWYELKPFLKNLGLTLLIWLCIFIMVCICNLGNVNQFFNKYFNN